MPRAGLEPATRGLEAAPTKRRRTTVDPYRLQTEHFPGLHLERRGISFARILQDGGVGPKLTHFQQVDDDPSPIDVDFRFPRFTEVDPELYASDHCPVFLDIPD